MKKVAAFVLLGVAACSSFAYAQSETENEVKQSIIKAFEYTNKNLTNGFDYSQHGALEFWSSGGLLQEIGAGGRHEEREVSNVHPKHIKVISLVEGQVAVAHYYSEGSVKLKGSSAVNYLTRVTQVFVKEAGTWKVRSSHFSPISGGSGTTQTAPER